MKLHLSSTFYFHFCARHSFAFFYRPFLDFRFDPNRESCLQWHGGATIIVIQLSCLAIRLSALQRKSHLCTPRKWLLRPPQSPFPHSCVCERFIYSQDRYTYFPAAEQADGSWEYLNRPQTHNCWNWDTGRAIPFLVIFISNLRYCVFAVCYSHLSVSYPITHLSSQPSNTFPYCSTAIHLSCLLYSHPSLLLSVYPSISLAYCTV